MVSLQVGGKNAIAEFGKPIRQAFLGTKARAARLDLSNSFELTVSAPARFRSSIPSIEIAFISKTRPIIAAVKSSMPPRSRAAAKSVISYTAKAATKAAAGIASGEMPAKRNADQRAAKAANIAANPRTAPQPRLFAVNG